MNLDAKLKKKQYAEIWQEYCGFFDFSLSEFMEMQNRLMLEQIGLYIKCELGQRILHGNVPETVDEFREMTPLTKYEDYADILLQHREEALPAKPVIWIETTWEGGKNPIKTAPYTQSMVDNHKSTFTTGLILSTSKKKGNFSLRSGDNFLYGMAPLPYFTGLVPYLLKGDLTINFLPPEKQSEGMSFMERTKFGIKMGMKKDVNLFFGMSSIISKIGEVFSGRNSVKGTGLAISFRILFRFAKAYCNKVINSQPILPKDIWHIKGLICGGTDTSSYKRKIEEQWGVRPIEMFAGTEPTCIGVETWSKDGMVFFPNVCFYEFIPEQEMLKNMADPNYQPKTYLMDELVAGELYELVISNFKGGAFARYRVGDVFRCLSLRNDEDGIDFPQFAYVDRIPDVIDISGFTRITERTIQEVIKISGLDIYDWFASKEFNAKGQAFLHIYIERGNCALSEKLAQQILQEHLSIYFRYVDSDYNDLKKLLGMDPLKISILPRGTIKNYVNVCNHTFRRMNPSSYDVTEIKKTLSR